MKIPKTPPRLNNDTKQSSTILIPEHLDQLNLTFEGKYLHWDELIHRKLPKGVNYEDFWINLRTCRQLKSKTVPLRNMEGRPFWFCEPDELLEVLHRLTLDAAGNVNAPEEVLAPQTRERYYISCLMQEAITSSQLEGAATTREIAKQLLASGRHPRDKHERMIANNYATMKALATLRHAKLTREALLTIHKTITEGTLDKSAVGRFRTPNERVVVQNDREIFHVPPNATVIEDDIARLVSFANNEEKKFLHPILRAIILHFWIGYLHPFVDGNGRTARAVFYWSLLHHGYWLFEYISISTLLLKAPAQYGRAFLLTETDGEDLTYFILHQLRTIDKSFKELILYVERKSDERLLLDSVLIKIPELNDRQRLILTDALKKRQRSVTIASHKNTSGVVYETARRDLIDLTAKNLFTPKKIGKQIHYFPVPNLDDVIQKLVKKFN